MSPRTRLMCSPLHPNYLALDGFRHMYSFSRYLSKRTLRICFNSLDAGPQTFTSQLLTVLVHTHACRNSFTIVGNCTMHLDQASQKMAATTRMQLQVAPVAAESAVEVVVEVAE